jgi:hypothetical protein
MWYIGNVVCQVDECLVQDCCLRNLYDFFLISRAEWYVNFIASSLWARSSICLTSCSLSLLRTSYPLGWSINYSTSILRNVMVHFLVHNIPLRRYPYRTNSSPHFHMLFLKINLMTKHPYTTTPVNDCSMTFWITYHILYKSLITVIPAAWPAHHPWYLNKSRDSAVCIATGYELDDQWDWVLVPLRARIFFFLLIFQTGAGPHSASSSMGIAGSFPGVTGRGMKLTIHLQLVPRPRKRGSVHPLPSYRDFTFYLSFHTICVWLRLKQISWWVLSSDI